MTRSMLIHGAVLALGLVILAGLYLVLQNAPPVVLGMIALVLAHLLVIGGVLYMGRGWITRVIQK